MGKGRMNPDLSGPDNLEQAMEILDEDHLEFEEMLLNLQQRAEHIETQLKQVAEKVHESRTETLETREMIENLEVKVDRQYPNSNAWILIYRSGKSHHRLQRNRRGIHILHEHVVLSPGEIGCHNLILTYGFPARRIHYLSSRIGEEENLKNLRMKR